MTKYLRLGDTHTKRWRNYRIFFEQNLDARLIDDIRKTTHQGMAIENTTFIDWIKPLTGYNLLGKSGGRPKGWRKNKI